MDGPGQLEMISLFLCGDVMTGRGIDQVLPHPVPPQLHEEYVRDARDYVALAETRNGPIRVPIGFDTLWGDALAVLEQAAPDVRLINLETSITTSEDWWPDKGIHYRMHPANAACLTAARIHCCALANNHVLDWGYRGLRETLTTLRDLGIATAGLGEDLEVARRPAVLEAGAKGRVIVFSFGERGSGIPPEWAAAADMPGVDFLPDLSPATARRIGERVAAVKRSRDVVVASIHWGGNWGYEVSGQQRAFAHALIEEAGVDLIHGHSSHHPRGIEVHQGRLILYGCGDFLNDYEGIERYRDFRHDLALMYLASVAPANGQLASLRMIPMRLRQLRPHRASRQDAEWLCGILDRESRPLGTRVRLEDDGALVLRAEHG
ncbi:CapA family protein [Hyalangium minutum]|uniref:Poly-gamma-glutamate synthesis protein n=1 Tax=Hyalangium minutum TaxID=394096 RepID=A0A085VYS5_9BACT|nr:CapA family protein [Hyalangium minutum]KFE60588.1 poly-gamma-glutamate synthesis protein [Hyalangium minutum]